MWYFADPRHTNQTFTLTLKYIQALHCLFDSLHGVYGEFHRALPVTIAHYLFIRPKICVLPPRFRILQTQSILITPLH